jgi:hypothetical protein
MFSQENGSEHAIAMNMPATSTTSVPTILNFNEAQSIDASKDYEFHWEAQTLNTESEILFSISDEIGNLIFMAPNTCIPRELPPSATSATVPAGYLKPGLKYRGVLRFGNIFYHSDSEVMDMVGIGAIYRFTTFPIQTGTGGTGGGIIPATFAEFGFNTEGKPTFSVSGSPLGTYLIQRSPTIVDPNWITQETLILDGTGIDIFVDNYPDLTFPAFYQAVGN